MYSVACYKIMESSEDLELVTDREVGELAVHQITSELYVPLTKIIYDCCSKNSANTVQL